ncbi:ras guanine nucleotide exchange factor domain-containing protein [Fimicolochytrium jonesii]|uniref:ras guanine nucleotide exchange factor domain-containing protein n=1 Tax=Fimicolochytrium jonesii TaxID=1396493 RepID=UPI0022FEC811|nr:ras guanine nucleotide exchange factor domain-containing protein [Fimicolochytrium jonesii]KAI8820233.1 ras guanine nucleotide exchange factor domain-containing protein [Fimicolochytrium jonesii]
MTIGRSKGSFVETGQPPSASEGSSRRVPTSDTGDEDDESSVCSMDDLQIWMSATSLYLPKTYQLFVTHRGQTVHLRVLANNTVGDAIQSILTDFIVATSGSFPVEPNRLGYRLCKLDRQSPGVRIWMESERLLGTYDLLQGDEVRLMHVADKETALISVPPSPTQQSLEYGFDVTVREAVAQLKAANPGEHSKDAKYGLYYPRLALWLDDGRTLFSYDLTSERNHLEFRALVNQFLLRIYLVEFNQKIALKVLPNLRAADVIAMIKYQLKNRKLEVGHIGGRYGIYIPSKSIWMKESDSLEAYETIKTEDVEYKLQYELVLIQCDLSEHQQVALNYTEPLRIHVDGKTTVETLLETIGLYNPDSAEEVYCLFSPAGDRLNEKDLVWTGIKDLAPGDALKYRAVPKKVILSNNLDSDVKIDVDLDYLRPLETKLPFICRRFGIARKHVLGIQTADGKELQTDKSLEQQGVAPGTKLVVKLDNATLRSPNAPSTPLATTSEDTNIWEEPEENNLHMIKDNDGTMVVGSASLNKLVEKLTDELGEGTVKYLDYVKTFLLTYQSFTTGSKLNLKLMERYHAPRYRKSTFASYDHFRLTIQLRVCNVLLQWVKRHPNDFLLSVNTKESKRKEVSPLWYETAGFVQDVLAVDHPNLAKQIRRNLVKIKDNSHPAMVKHLILKSPMNTGDVDPRKMSVFSHQVEEIAQQLTLIEHAFLADILPSELLNQAWSKSDAATRAPNITALTRRFNAVACWTAKSVLEMKTPRARAKRMTILIDVATHLLQLNNFSTLMAVIAGLNKAAVSRLKQTFKEVGAKNLKKLNDMEKLMTAEGSYRNYRGHMKTVSRPWVYLIDLTYMEDGNPDNIEHRINFTKRQMISGVINEILSFQQTGYTDIKPMEELYNVIARLPAATDEYEKILWSESKKRE